MRMSKRGESELNRNAKRIAAKEASAIDLVTERWYVIKTSTSWMYAQWYYLVMFAAIINSVWTPMTISFSKAIELG